MSHKFVSDENGVEKIGSMKCRLKGRLKCRLKSQVEMQVKSHVEMQVERQVKRQVINAGGNQF